MIKKIKDFMAKKPSGDTISRAALIFLGAIFLFSGIGKIVQPPDLSNIFVAGILGQDSTAVLWGILPFLEVVLGLLLILRVKIKWVSWVVLGVLLVFITNNVWLIAMMDEGFDACGQCLGWGIDTWPIGSLYIDLMMLGLLLLGTYHYQKREVSFE